MKSPHLSRAALLPRFSPLNPSAHPQGCTQCLDNTAATPPATQRAYRHAIEFMTITAGSLFVGTIALLRRFR